jgi:ribonucleoside-diphosphate reductase alpha chain
MSRKNQHKLRFKPIFADPKKHPYKQVDWDDYGQARGLKLRDLIDRVVDKYLATGWAAGYFATAKDRDIFQRELIWLLLNQTLSLDLGVWLTVGRDGPQRVSALAGDFVLLNNTECPRALVDLTRFVGDDGRFDFDKFISVVEIATTMLDIAITLGDFSTAHIGGQAKKLRPIGLILGNLEKFLVEYGLTSGSEAGRAVASALASLASATAYRCSAELAAALNIPQNKTNPQIQIIKKHHHISLQLTDAIVDNFQLAINLNEIIFAANLEWGRALELGESRGWRNCQLFLIAPSDNFVYEQK